MMFLVQFLLLISSAHAQQSAELWVCVGSQCGGGQFESPLYSTGNGALDQARWHAYRYEKDQQYQKAIDGIYLATQLWLEQKKLSEQLSTVDYQKLQKEAFQKISDSLPPLPSSMPTLKQRREVNPYPVGAKANLDQRLDHVWKEIKGNSPHKIARTVSRELKSLASDQIEDEFIQQETQKRRQFMEKELALSRVTDHQGLLNFPFVQKPDFPLSTSPSSSLGQELREQINRHYANETVVRTHCQAQPSEACEQVSDQLVSTTAALYAMDRLGSMQGWARDSQYSFMLDRLSQQVAAFEGIIESATDFVEAIKSLPQVSPKAILDGIAHAVVNYEDTAKAIAQGIQNSWKEFVDGTPEERSKILGKLTFEVASSMVPVPKVAWVGKTLQTSKLAAHGVELSVDVLNQVGRLGLTSKSVESFNALAKIDNILKATKASATGIKQSFDLLTPTGLKAYEEAIEATKEILDSDALDYVTKQTIFADKILPDEAVLKEFSSQELIRKVESYVPLRDKMATVKGVLVTETVWRGIAKRHNPLADSFFKVFEGSILMNGRFSAPGDSALYTIIDDGKSSLASIKSAISREAKESVEDLAFRKTKFELKNVLDLTDPNTLEALGLSIGDLAMESYEMTHQLAHIAKRQGFDGIKTFSAPNLVEKKINLIKLIGD